MDTGDTDMPDDFRVKLDALIDQTAANSAAIAKLTYDVDSNTRSMARVEAMVVKIMEANSESITSILNIVARLADTLTTHIEDPDAHARNSD